MAASSGDARHVDVKLFPRDLQILSKDETMIRTFLLTITLFISNVSAFAAERIAYDARRFDEALSSGSPVIVHITAPWCGECRKQKPIVAELSQMPEYTHLIIVDIDFDTQKDALRALNVVKQSTLIAIRNGKEVDRATGITKRDAIDTLMRKAL